MSTSARRRRILDACLGAALAVSACKQGEPVVAPDTTGSSPTAAPGAIEIAPVDHPSQMLPGDTSLLVLGSNINRVAEVFERERLIAAFGAQYESVSAAARMSLGHDLFDPGVWKDVGLDADGPIGVSFSGISTARMVVFATIADRDKLVAFIREVAGKSSIEMVEERYGSSSVLRAKGQGGAAIVLRDRVVAMIFDGRSQEGFDLPQIMATIDPNVSLAAALSFRQSTGGLHSSDLSVYVDIARMVGEGNMESEARSAKPESNWAQEELVAAQKRGADPEQIADLERQAFEETERQAKWRKREAGERALAELVFSGIEGVGLSASAKRSGPVLDGRIVAGEGAFLRRLVNNVDSEPLMPRVMNGTPLWCMAGGLQADATFELLEAVAGAEGMTWGEFSAEAKSELGLDLDAELQPALGSEVGLCVVVEGSLDLDVDEPSKQLGVGAYLQVADAAKAKYLLAKVATSRSTLAKQMRRRGNGYTIDVPKWRTLHVDPVGDRIVVSTDRELAKRIAAGDPGSMPSKIQPTAARGAMGLQGTAASQAFDLSLMTLWLMASSTSFDMPMSAVPGMSPEELKKVRHSSKSKKAKKALDKAREEVKRLDRKREAQDLEQILAITGPLGIGVVAAMEDERGFTLTGGQFIRAESLGAVLEGLLRAATMGGERMDSATEGALSDAWTRESEASQAYSEARAEDVQRFRDKQAKNKR